MWPWFSTGAREAPITTGTESVSGSMSKSTQMVRSLEKAMTSTGCRHEGSWFRGSRPITVLKWCRKSRQCPVVMHKISTGYYWWGSVIQSIKSTSIRLEGDVKRFLGCFMPSADTKRISYDVALIRSLTRILSYRCCLPLWKSMFF